MENEPSTSISRYCLAAGATAAPADVSAANRSEDCPSAAKGFWGCLALGLLTTGTRNAKSSGAALLSQDLLHIGSSSSIIPANVVPVLLPWHHDPDLGKETAAERIETGWMQPGPHHFRSYHVREFLCAILVLLRMQPFGTSLLDWQAVTEVHYQILKVRS